MISQWNDCLLQISEKVLDLNCGMKPEELNPQPWRLRHIPGIFLRPGSDCGLPLCFLAACPRISTLLPGTIVLLNGTGSALPLRGEALFRGRGWSWSLEIVCRTPFAHLQAAVLPSLSCF